MSFSENLKKAHDKMADKVKVIEDDTDLDYMPYNSLSIFYRMIAVIAVCTSVMALCTKRYAVLPITLLMLVIGVGFGHYIRGRRVSHKVVSGMVFVLEMTLTVLGPVLFIYSGGIHGSATIWVVFALTLTVVMLKGKTRMLFFWGELAIYLIVVMLTYFDIIEYRRLSGESAEYASVIVALVCISMAIAVYIMYIQEEFGRQQKRLRAEIAEANEKREEALRLMEESEKSNRVATAALRAKEQFLANMSHEIKTPLNAVVGLAEIIGKVDSKEELFQMSKSIAGAARGLDCVVSNIIEYAARGDIEIKINNSPYNIEALFAASKNMSVPRLEAKGVEFVVERGSIPQMLVGDLVRVQNLLFNILNSVIKYTNSGKVVFKCDYDNHNNVLLMTVTGTTTGVDKESIMRYINILDSEIPVEDISMDGADIGLAVCKKIVTALSGTMFIDCDENGLLFRVTFPQKPFVPDAGEASGEKSKGTPDFNGKKVMYVDSAKVNHLIFDSTLLDTGAFLGHSFNPKDVLARSSEELKEYDLFIMDPNLPNMDGKQLIVHLRGRGVRVPIICACQNLNDETRKMYMEQGFNDCIQKPLVALQLLGLCAGVFKGLKGPGER